MDFGKLTLDELQKGYVFDKEADAFLCNCCGERFPNSQVFPLDGGYFTAEHAVKRHVANVHGGTAALLINADTKYNGLTEVQKDLLLRIAAGGTDRDIAKALSITEATVRRQRFNFREKAKQAKLYLAQYEQAFSGIPDELMPIHNQAAYVDDRYVITEAERERILIHSFASLQPLRLKAFPPKEKKKVVILTAIAAQFEKGRHYTEREVNDVILPIYADYVTIRRYLISYGLMNRTVSGSEYWMTE